MTDPGTGPVLVTGVTGRVGSAVAGELLAAGVAVRGMVIPGDPLLARVRERLPAVELVEASLSEGDPAGPGGPLDRAVAGCGVVVHLAAQLVVGDAPADLLRVNSIGTFHLVEAMVRTAPPGRPARLVAASSDGTYGSGRPGEHHYTEQSAQNPGDYYGLSKVLMERVIWNAASQHGLPFTVLRFSTVVGTGEVLGRYRYGQVRRLLGQAAAGRASNLWPLFEGHDLAAELARQLGEVAGSQADPAVALYGPAGQPWATPVVYVRDVAAAVVAAVTAGRPLLGAVNVTAPASTAYDEGAAAVARALGLPLHRVELPVLWRYTVGSTAAERLGFRPVWTFDRMVDDALAATGQPRTAARA